MSAAGGLTLHLIAADPTVPLATTDWREQFSSDHIQSWWHRRGHHLGATTCSVCMLASRSVERTFRLPHASSLQQPPRAALGHLFSGSNCYVAYQHVSLQPLLCGVLLTWRRDCSTSRSPTRASLYLAPMLLSCSCWMWKVRRCSTLAWHAGLQRLTEPAITNCAGNGIELGSGYDEVATMLRGQSQNQGP